MLNTVKAIRIHETGGPEVMRWEDVEIGLPGPGEVRLRHTAVGLNYIDANHRSGSYPLPALPAVIGMEGAGVIEDARRGGHRFRGRRAGLLLHGPRQLLPGAGH